MPIEIGESKDETTKILIVDDDSSVQNFLKTLLSGLFIDIDVASDGFEAGKKIVQFKPDIIILDLFMPNMNGFEVCEKIRSDSSTRKIKILILSGHLTDENKSKAFSSGADAVLPKPSSKKEILNCVEKLLKANT